jgi:hypothetical protein
LNGIHDAKYNYNAPLAPVKEDQILGEEEHDNNDDFVGYLAEKDKEEHTVDQLPLMAEGMDEVETIMMALKAL